MGKAPAPAQGRGCPRTRGALCFAIIEAEATPLLEAIPVLRGLNSVERHALGRISRLGIYKPGDLVFQEGERTSEMSFVAIGAVKIVKSTAARRIILRIVSAGGPIGLVAAFESRPYPASAIALIPTTVIHVPERGFLAAMDRHPEIIRQLLHLMMCRQVDLGRRVSEMTGPVEGRVAQVLLDLAEETGRQNGEAVEIPLPLSRQDLADLAGTTPETAIRIMSRWGKEGLVITSDEGFRIRSVAALKALSEV